MLTDRIAAHLRRTYGSLPLAVSGFARPLTACSLANCHGMCCYDGVYLDAPMEAQVSVIAQARRLAFADMGLDLPASVVVDGSVGGVRYGRKTATRPWAGDQAFAGFPAHFENTSCVFHLDDGRCGLQVLAIQDGLHPWAYKPTSCWLFPITIHRGAIQVFDETSDPSRYDAYPGFVAFTRCGATCLTGRPAREVLREELRYLGDILGRDLIAEAGADMPRPSDVENT